MLTRVSWWGPAVILIAVVVVFLGAGRHTRLVEDDQVVWNNSAVSGNALDQALLGRFYDSRSEFRRVVRPLATLALRAEHGAFSYARAPYQWTLLLMHWVAATLFFFVLRRSFRSPMAALLGGLTFAVHPAVTESTLRLAGTSDVLALVLTMAALLVAGQERRSRQRGVLTAGIILLAALSKEAALAAIPAVWLFATWRRSDAGGKDGDRERAHAAFLGVALQIAAAAVLALRILSIAAVPAEVRQAVVVDATTGVSTWRAVLAGLGAVETYVRLTFFPLTLGYAHDYLYSSSSGLLVGRALVGGTILAALGFGTVRAWRARSVAAGWYTLAFLPLLAALGIVYPMGDFASPRLLYAALPGIIGLVIHGWNQLARRRGFGAQPVAFVLGLAVVGAFAVRTAIRAADFADRERLIRAQVAAYAGSAMGHYDLGNFYLEEGRFKGAQTEYERALAIRPDLWIGWVNLGAAYFGQDEPGLAMRAYERAAGSIQGRPEYRWVWGKLCFNKAVILMQQDRNAEAAQSLLETVRIFPQHLRAHACLGLIFANSPKFDRESIDHFTRALELETDPESRRTLEGKLSEVKRRRAAFNEREGRPPDWLPERRVPAPQEGERGNETGRDRGEGGADSTANGD